MRISTFAALISLLIVQPESGYGQSGSFSIYFATGKTILNDAQTRSLDSFLYNYAIRPKATITITGYADAPGTAAINKAIATGRAASVKAYLRSSGIEDDQIVQCTGVGNARRSGEDIHQRRVDIVFDDPKRSVVINRKESKVIKAPGQPPTRKRSLRDVQKMKPGELMVIENLQFKVSTDIFEQASMPILQELAEALQDFPGVKIRLEGHVCCGGKEDSAKKLSLGYQLSLSRAQAVLQYLEAHGISASRLSCAGFGFSQPKIFPEKSLEDSYVNRRVEIRIVANTRTGL